MLLIAGASTAKATTMVVNRADVNKYFKVYSHRGMICRFDKISAIRTGSITSMSKAMPVFEIMVKYK